MDPDGGEWEQKYEVIAPDSSSAMDVGRKKARKANRYAQGVCCYGAKMLDGTRKG